MPRCRAQLKYNPHNLPREGDMIFDQNSRRFFFSLIFRVQSNPHVVMWQFAVRFLTLKTAYQKQKLSKMLTSILAILTLAVFNFHNFYFSNAVRYVRPDIVRAVKCVCIASSYKYFMHIFTNNVCTLDIIHLNFCYIITIHIHMWSDYLSEQRNSLRLHMLLFAFIRLDALYVLQSVWPLFHLLTIALFYAWQERQ